MANRSLEAVIRKQYRALIQEEKRLPLAMAAMALRHFKQGMQREGFVDSRLSKWPEVQRRIPGHPRYNPKQQQKMLVGPGSGGIMNTLRRKEANMKRVVIASMGKEYALYHNNGEGKLPQRKFLGNSSKLEANVEALVKQTFDKAFRRS